MSNFTKGSYKKKGMVAIFFSLCALAFFTLSAWQWQRAEHKRALLAKFAAAEGNATILLAQNSKIFDGQTVKTTGEFLKQPVFLLQNQFYKHQVGVNVLHLFKTQLGHYLLVNDGFSKASEPIAPCPDLGKITLTGTSYIPKHNPFIKDEKLTAQNIQPLFNINFAALEKHFHQPFFPFVLRLHEGGCDASLIRDWPAPVVITPERHLGYALQWFLLALLSILFGVWLMR